MASRANDASSPPPPRTTVVRASDCEMVVTSTIHAPAAMVYRAFADADLLRRWWVPQSMGMALLSCEVDARVGGTYRLTFDVGGPEPAAFYGTYLEAVPGARLAWTNDEGADTGSVTTVTFAETGDRTRVEVRERYATKEALDAAGTGPSEALVETFEQLEQLLVGPGGKAAS
jgi:uncharacterized protein YndB with AHSA1/START domain